MQPKACCHKRAVIPTSLPCWEFPMCLAAINKMDLVGYREDVFLRLQDDFLALSRTLADSRPCSACPLARWRATTSSTAAATWRGIPGRLFLSIWKLCRSCRFRASNSIRFPVQYVIRPDATFAVSRDKLPAERSSRRSVMALPSRQTTRVDPSSLLTANSTQPCFPNRSR